MEYTGKFGHSYVAETEWHHFRAFPLCTNGLMKLTPAVSFIIISQAAFIANILTPKKIQTQTVNNIFFIKEVLIKCS